MPQQDQSENWQFTRVVVIVLVALVVVALRVVEDVWVRVSVRLVVVVSSTCCALLIVMAILALVKAWLMLWVSAVEDEDRSE